MAQLQGDYVGLWRSYCKIMLTFSPVTCDYVGFRLNYSHIIFVFGAFIGRLFWPLSKLQGDNVGLCAFPLRLCWFLAQLLPHYFGLSRSYWEIILTFGAVTGRLCWPLA